MGLGVNWSSVKGSSYTCKVREDVSCGISGWLGRATSVDSDSTGILGGRACGDEVLMLDICGTTSVMSSFAFEGLDDGIAACDWRSLLGLSLGDGILDTGERTGVRTAGDATLDSLACVA